MLIRKSFRGEEFFTILAEALESAYQRSLKTNKFLYVAIGFGEYMVQAHGVELIGYKVTHSFYKGKTNNMINLTQAKKQGITMSKENGGKKIYVVENGVNDYMTSNAPFKGNIGYCLNGEFIPNDKLNNIEMAKTAKKAAKKVAPKKSAAKKVVAKKVAVATKKVTTNTKEGGKIVDISIADMRKNMAEGYFYRDPQGVRQSENYLASRTNQDLVRTGMQEFKS